jgi:ABC-type sugar transport system ATPase subunit
VIQQQVKLTPQHASGSGNAEGLDALLVAEGISVRYGDKTVLDSAELRMGAGELVVLVGPNGSGKSTLCKVLAGLLRPDSGSIRVYGRRLRTGDPAEARRRGIFLVPQTHPLLPQLTVMENARLFIATFRPPYRRRNRLKAPTPPPLLRLLRRRDGGRQREDAALSYRDALVEWAEKLGISGRLLEAKTKVGDLPDAVRRQIAVCIALAARPRVAILDEATASFTGASQERLRSSLESFLEEGRCVIAVEHRPQELAEMASRSLRIEEGRLVVLEHRAEHEKIPSRHSPSTAPAAPGRHKGNVLVIELVAAEAGKNPVVTSDARPSAGTDVSADANPSAGTDVSAEAEAAPASENTASFGRWSAAIERGELVGALAPSEDIADLFVRALADPASAPSYGLRLHLGGRIAVQPRNPLQATLFPSLSVAENMALSTGRPRLDPELARRLGFAAKPSQPVAELSGGTAVKLALLEVLSLWPDVLVLEEPFYSLDTQSAKELSIVLRERTKQGAAVVLVSTDADSLAMICDRVISLDRLSLAVRPPSG